MAHAPGHRGPVDPRNAIQFASFNPTGTQFVAIYGDDANKHKLYFHDGTTGLRVSNMDLLFKPDHPDWSPDGKYIAVTHVGNEATTSQRPTQSGIDFLTYTGATLGAPQVLVPQASMKNRYNPNFVPDSSFLFYSESTCTTGPNGSECDADADPSAKTWAVKPVARRDAGAHDARVDRRRRRRRHHRLSATRSRARRRSRP